MYLNVYLFHGPHEVDFVIENKMDYLQNLMSPNGWVVNRREGGLLQKNDYQTGGLLERGVNSEIRIF